MKAFVRLYKRIDETTSTNEKVAALVDYFHSDVSDKDKLWTIALFTHRKPPRSITTTQLRTWAATISKIPEWLFEETYQLVGDLAETIALVLPKVEKSHDGNLSLNSMIQSLLKVKQLTEEEKKEWTTRMWLDLTTDERFLFNKLITGGFRLGISQNLLTKALATYLEEDESRIAHKLMGNWSPEDTDFSTLLRQDMQHADISKPYPFFLAYAIEMPLEDLGPANEWIVEHKWDGIRGQLIKRQGQLFVWSRGEELVTDKYPEFKKLTEIQVDNYVLDGEILGFKEGIPLPFNDLQTRIGRKNISSKMLSEKPVVFMAYDLLEFEGEDIRQLNYESRRNRLDLLLQRLGDVSVLKKSPSYHLVEWDQAIKLREDAKSFQAEGLMLKQLSSAYQTGRKKGGWWKWKIDPLTVDAVLIYAQRGHGRRASLFTDFTFAVRGGGGTLLPFAKAYSGLTDEEFKEVTNYVRTNTVEKFGPVVSVVPSLVFEIAFEGIALSPRHKSGVALRFPRIKRWRKDKSIAEINHIDDLMALL